MAESYANKESPSADIENMTLDECRDTSRSCENCNGAGHAVIFDKRYRGLSYQPFPDRHGHATNVLLRTVAYCVCNAGRKIMFNHQKTNPELHRRTYDLHDVIADRTRFQLKDPRPMPDDEPGDLENPPHWRELVKRFAALIKAPETKLKKASRRGDPILEAAFVPDGSDPPF